MSKKRAKKIKLIIFDVDGTLTDGKLFFIPVPLALRADPKVAMQIEVKGFHAHDGAGISLARLGGLKTGLITKRNSETVALRARDLKIDYVHQGIQDKLTCLEGILKEAGMKSDEVAYVGDDVIDIPIMRSCGLAIAVSNARDEVKKEAHLVTKNAGGDGGARDAIEYVLKAQGKWKKVVAEYVFDREGKKRPAKPAKKNGKIVP